MGLRSMFLERGLRKEPVVVHPEGYLFEQQYDQLASKLGVHCRAAVDVSLRKTLAKQMVGVYDLAKVEQYMDAKGYWGWFPLREVDRVKTEGRVWLLQRQTPTDYPPLFGRAQDTLYENPVPYPVLCTVRDLAAVLGDDVVFLVAALTKHPDPFLGVWSKESHEMYVIERWDEPRFRG